MKRSTIDREPTDRERRRRRTLVMTAALVTSTAGMAAGLGSPVAGQEGAPACDDGRPWTRDISTETPAGGHCEYQNLCDRIEIMLTTGDEITWAWEFPAQCPEGAIDVVGVALEREVAVDPDGDLTQGTITRIENRGTPDPGRTGKNSAPAVCGSATATFIILSGADIVATGEGSTEGPPCPASSAEPREPGILGAFTDSTDNAGALARLYWTVFGRAPDRAGIDYWMGRASAGATVREIAANWVGLKEWIDVYGAAGDREFAEAMYLNVLGRNPDPDGIDYWVTRLSDGLPRSEMATLLSDSTELRQRTRTG